METHCNAEILCDKLILLRPKTNPVTEKQQLAPVSEINEDEEHESNTHVEYDEESQVVCLTQRHNLASEKCGVCMREKSRSSTLAEFQMPHGSDLCFVYVLYTSTTNDVIADTCSATRAC